MTTGGIAGENSGTISECRSSITIDATRWIDGYSSNTNLKCLDYIGGIAGKNSKTIKQCHSKMTLTATPESYGQTRGHGWYDGSVGGIVGYNASTSSVQQCVAELTNKITFGADNCGFIDYCSGGLIGSNYGTLSDSYATGNITNSMTATSVHPMQDRTGGAVGLNSGTSATVKQVYSTVNIIDAQTDSGYIGGLIGNNDTGANVIKCFSLGNVCLTQAAGYGEALGQNKGTVMHLYYRQYMNLRVNNCTVTSTCTEGTATPLATLQSPDFIYNTLFWDETIWTAVEGQNPTLK